MMDPETEAAINYWREREAEQPTHRAYAVMSQRADGTPPDFRKALGTRQDSAEVYWFREHAERDCAAKNREIGPYYAVFPLNIVVLPKDYTEDDI